MDFCSNDSSAPQAQSKLGVASYGDLLDNTSHTSLYVEI